MPWLDRILGALTYGLVIVLDLGFPPPIVPSGFIGEQEQGGRSSQRNEWHCNG